MKRNFVKKSYREAFKCLDNFIPFPRKVVSAVRMFTGLYLVSNLRSFKCSRDHFRQ